MYTPADFSFEVMSRTNHVLQQFGENCRELAHLLKDGTFTHDDRRYVENHLLIVQLALAISKLTHSRAQVTQDE